MSPLRRPDPPRTLGEATAQLDALWGIVGALHEQNEELREQVRQLGERLGKSSRNSSKAPSSDSPEQREKRPRRPRSTRRQGAQPGHPRHQRPLAPEADVDDVRNYFPGDRCGCGATVAIESEPACRHQVFDLPPVRVHLTEHRLFGGCCTGCGKRHVAELPDTVPSGQMGPGLVAWIALMSGEYRLSVRQIRSLLAELWQVSFSAGAISNAQGQTSEALAAPYAAIADHVREADVAHADETRHPRGGVREHACTWWMWVLTTGTASFFGVHFSRGKNAAAELLGKFAGVLVTDDLGSYGVVPAARRQLCWAHLIRHFTAMSERGGSGGKVGRRLLVLARAVIRTRHRLEDGRIGEAVYRRRIGRLRSSIAGALERGSGLRRDTRTRGQCRHLLGREALLWTFLADRRIALTNNVAERALRPYVIWRKVALASHSRRGDHFRARMLSVATTAKALKVPLYEYLRRVCTEAQSPGGVRTLLPLAKPASTLPSR